MSQKFVADVGGTNIRVARVTESGVADIKKYMCNDFASIDLAIAQYFSDMPEYSFSQGCIAIACPVLGDQVDDESQLGIFSNALRSQLKLDALFVINDFTAVAHSLPVLGEEQVVQIGEGTAKENGNIAVFDLVQDWVLSILQ